MSWSDLHRKSERLAEAAHEALRAGDGQLAANLFSQAARLEAELYSSWGLTNRAPMASRPLALSHCGIRLEI
jgi:hypothetical protein